VQRFFDALLGRTRPVKSKAENLFAMSTASITLTVDLQLKATGRAGICFRPVASSRFDRIGDDLNDLLKVSGKESGTKFETVTDPYNFQWVVMEDGSFEDLVATVHVVNLTLEDGGYGEQLLASVFRFADSKGQTIFWIYNYKRGLFYPFVPTGERRRDNAYELRLSAVMEHELPIEKDYERWFPLWGIPV
jgi:hypothetical protein